jgi:sugar O-acyltransferase (sialic acid O-acetyltransferase NeuD family)
VSADRPFQLHLAFRNHGSRRLRILSTNVLGASGHAKVVIRSLRELGYQVSAAFDDDPRKWSSAILGVPIVGPLERVSDFPALPAVIAIGDNNVRRKTAERFDLDWLTVVDPKAVVDSTVKLGRGTVVLPGAVIQVDSQVGEHVIVNTCASVDHDCQIENFVHVAPGVHLAGEVIIRTGTFVGIGAVAIPQIEIGAWSKVGAGAVVVRDLPGRIVAVGVPARIKNATEAET